MAGNPKGKFLMEEEKILKKYREYLDNLITKRTRALRVISLCNQTLIRATDEQGFLNNLCKLLVKKCGYRFAWVGYAERDKEKSVKTVAQAGLGKGYPKHIKISWAPNRYGRGPTGTAIRTGRTAIARRISTDPGYKLWRAAAIKRGYVSSIALPLKANGKVFGALSMYAAEPDAFDRDEVKLLNEMANDLAYGITALRTKTAHAKAEEKVEESEKRLKSTMDNMMESCQIVGFDWKYKYINDATALQGHKPKEELLGHTMMEAYPGIEKTKMFEALRHCMKTRRPQYMTNEFTYPDGSKGWFELSIQPSPEGVFILSQDITERKKAEVLLLARSDIAEELIGTYSLAEAAKVILENMSRIEHVDSGSVYIINQDTGESDLLAQKNLSEQFVRIASHYTKNDKITRLMLRGKPAYLDHAELRQEKAASAEGLRSLAMVPIKYEGKIIASLNLASHKMDSMPQLSRDMIEDIAAKLNLSIARVRSVEAALRQLEELKGLDRMKTEFMNIAAHELKSPMVPIMTYLQMLQEGKYGDISTEQREVMENIIRNGKRLNKLTNDVLDTLKLESALIKFEFGKADLKAIIEFCTDNYVGLAKRKNIEIKTEISDIPDITGDENRLIQVFSNLIDNAVKFTDKGTVTVSAKRKGNNVVISVKDTGVGMSREQLSHMFQRFYQAETAIERKAEGTGLGLVIVKGIVEAHGGKITAESAGLGKGSTFTISLPVKNKNLNQKTRGGE